MSGGWANGPLHSQASWLGAVIQMSDRNHEKPQKSNFD